MRELLWTALGCSLYVAGFITSEILSKRKFEMNRLELDNAIETVRIEALAAVNHVASLPVDDFTDEVNKLTAIADELKKISQPPTV